MSLFRKFFGASSEGSNEDKEKDSSPYLPDPVMPIDELFTYKFKKNGGKFLYCENLPEVHDNFESILEENDWFEKEAMCLEPKLYSLLDENKLNYTNPKEPKFLLASCESLIADEGSILFSSNQIKQFKPNDLPANIVILATTSQITGNKSDGLREIKKKYDKEYPTNITTFKYFEKAKEEDFLQYGSCPKNLYLLLLEDL
ncbi:lactate utilization protein B/C [Flavobacterium sp. SM15]|uniref:lactate utilization protein B/C n=1 Tax=Flavobacterium sp. SM15 TaxID=2908005 RepID=UPI001EDC2085|nr:lactate utilization protein B/C [Flavobacterium sp. SM15]MCG2612415.1 lactate utilization protein B/C [Flavobacterium sp. SM15]